MTANERCALEALEAISRDGWPVTVREIAAACDVSVSTAHRLLGLLRGRGLAARHPRSDLGSWLPCSRIP